MYLIGTMRTLGIQEDIQLTFQCRVSGTTRQVKISSSFYSYCRSHSCRLSPELDIISLVIAYRWLGYHNVILHGSPGEEASRVSLFESGVMTGARSQSGLTQALFNNHARAVMGTLRDCWCSNSETVSREALVPKPAKVR